MVIVFLTIALKFYFTILCTLTISLFYCLTIPLTSPIPFYLFSPHHDANSFTDIL